MWAACGGHVEVVRVFLEAGANKDAADEVRSEGWCQKRRGGLGNAPCLPARSACPLSPQPLDGDDAPALGGRRCVHTCGVCDKPCSEQDASPLLCIKHVHEGDLIKF